LHGEIKENPKKKPGEVSLFIIFGKTEPVLYSALKNDYCHKI
jgi:hypothetical protein